MTGCVTYVRVEKGRVLPKVCTQRCPVIIYNIYIYIPRLSLRMSNPMQGTVGLFLLREIGMSWTGAAKEIRDWRI